MSSGNDADEDLLVQVSKTARKLSHLKLNHVQVEILRELMDGRRTVSELTFTIFNSRYTDEGYETYHSRVIRAVKSLEKKGYIARSKIFGRNIPYKLTQHGVACIASITPEMKEPKFIGSLDFALYTITLLFGFIAWRSLYPIWANLFTFLLGMTVLRTIIILRRIM